MRKRGNVTYLPGVKIPGEADRSADMNTSWVERSTVDGNAKQAFISCIQAMNDSLPTAQKAFVGIDPHAITLHDANFSAQRIAYHALKPHNAKLCITYHLSEEELRANIQHSGLKLLEPEACEQLGIHAKEVIVDPFDTNDPSKPYGIELIASGASARNLINSMAQVMQLAHDGNRR